MPEPEADGMAKDTASEKPMDDEDLKKLPERLRELFLTGNIQGCSTILEQVCEKYRTSDETGKKMITGVFEAQSCSPKNGAPPRLLSILF